MARARTVAVVGGGLGGLTAALALARGGCEVTVYEQAPALSEIGAGISLWSNAVAVLAALDLADLPARAGAPVDRVDAYTHRGRPVSSLRVDELDRPTGVRSHEVHRFDLQRGLAEALGRQRLRLGRRCIDVTRDGDRATVVLEHGERVEADVVVGADGIRSVVRERAVGAASVRYAGYVAWRGVVDGFAHQALAPRTALGIAGPGAQAGALGLGGGRVYWFATANGPARGDGPGAGDRDELLERFGGWWAIVPALIGATAPERLIRTDIVDLSPLARWSAGRVTLLGDAAHATTPNLGQGACQAIEDAFVLGQELARDVPVETALATYERRRRSRARAVVRASRIGGRLLQAESPALIALRDGPLARPLAAAVRRQMAGLLAGGPATRRAR